MLMKLKMNSNPINIVLHSCRHQRYRRSSFLWETAREWGMDQCGQMAVCEAHARYDNYGFVALPLTLFFPG